MKLVKVAALVLLYLGMWTVGIVRARAIDDPPAVPLLTATNIDLDRARVVELERLLAEARALIVGLKADVAVAQANAEQARHDVQSLQLTNEASEALKAMELAYPGQHFYWDNNTRRVVAVKQEDGK